jgi:hypothetical protein
VGGLNLLCPKFYPAAASQNFPFAASSCQIDDNIVRARTRNIRDVV